MGTHGYVPEVLLPKVYIQYNECVYFPFMLCHVNNLHDIYSKKENILIASSHY